jgi:hypothetical protein
MNEINDLLNRIDTPPTDVDVDVTRGQRALRRRHRWQTGAAVLSVAAVVTGGVALRGADPGTETGYAGQGSSAPLSTATTMAPRHSKAVTPHSHHHMTADQRNHQIHLQQQDPRAIALLQGYRAVLAEHIGLLGDLGPANGQWGRHLGADTSIGTHIDWDHGGEIEIGVASSWSVTEWPYYPAQGTDITFQGHQARVLVDGQDLYVSVQHADGQVVTVTASATYGNNHTSITTTGLTENELLAAAADPRLTIPDWVS